MGLCDSPSDPGTNPTPPAGPAAPCVTCTITSQTVATQPANRARTKIGVGEEVSCTFSLGSATWSLAGGGTLSSTSGATVTYTAGDTGGSATLTATGSGCTSTITFTIVAPSSVHMDRISAVQHTKLWPDVGMRTTPFVGPDDVSFYNIQYREVDVPMQGGGVYSCHIGASHDPHPATLSASTTVTAGKGTQMNASDHVYSGACAVAPANPTGFELFPIPYEYKVGSGSFHNFATVDQRVSCVATGALQATKASAQADTTVGANTVTI
jgi:hypothetical protein